MRTDYRTPTGGITSENRERLARLHRRAPGPFTVADASRALDEDPTRTRKLLAYLAARGWLSRIRRDLYKTVPLDAAVPAEWREDVWVVAARLFAPCYVGGWSACEHWGLTDQLFRAVVVVTARSVRDRRPEIQGTPFRLKTASEDRMFGIRPVWRSQVRVSVSDPSRTVVDVLDDPAVGGGIRHVAEVVGAYLAGEARDDALLVEYARRLGNRTVFKRLGYLVETHGIDAPDLLAACRENLSAGVSLLDPALPAAGRAVSRWRLRLNAAIAPERA